MTPRKKLIEVALPLEAINVASAREKSIRHGHPSTLHLWFARRPLAACRAVIFASLVDDPDDADAPAEFVAACKALPFNEKAVKDTPRQRLFKFMELLVQWESTIDEKVLETARHLIRLATGGNPPPLLDPFAGGGSIPLEAQRLGLEAHASDLNPIPVMINKALIEIPPKFANCPPVNPRDREKLGGAEDWHGAAGLAADIRYFGAWMRDEAWKRIGHLYPKGPNGETVIAWIWARTVISPNPAVNVHVPLVRSFELSKKTGHKAWVEPQIDQKTKQITFIVRTGEGIPPKGTIDRRGGRCIVSGTPIPTEYIRTEGKAGRLGTQLLAIVTEGQNRRNYYSPDEFHAQIASQVEPTWQPTMEMGNNPRHMSPPLYGMTTFADIFTSRQLVALNTFSDLVGEVRERIYQDSIAAGLLDNNVPLRDDGSGARAYTEALSIYLAFAVDRLAEKCNSLSSWQNTADFVRGVFARQAISMVWDFAEVNPFSGSTGNFGDALEWIGQALESVKIDFLSTTAINSVHQQNAMAITTSFANPIISTDPPYYDNVPYADLSDFFYIWLRRSIRDIFPEIFSTLLVPKESELVADHQRYGSREAANQHFEKGLQKSFENMRQLAHPSYPLTVYYAFRQSESDDDEGDETQQVVSNTGWDTMLEGLIHAGFAIDGTWPMRTERGGRTRDLGSNALASSIVLVCRPRSDDAPTASRRQFIDALRREMPIALKELQSGNIAPVDLAQASIGPGMAIYSRYSKIIEANGSSMTVRTALQIINQELDTFLAEQEGDIDADSRFAISWFEQFGFNEGEFGQADVLARAKNTSVEGVQRAEVIESGRGKVRLLHHKELDLGWEPAEDSRLTVWETVNHLIARLNHRGESGAAALLIKLPGDLGSQARELAYRLYNICERKGWAEHAFDYNALVISWPAIQEEANKLRSQASRETQQPLFGEE